MTRDETLAVASLVFGVKVWAVVGYWDIKVETVPARTLIFTNDWVERNIESGYLQTDNFEQMLRGIQDSKWLKDSNGELHCLFR